MECKLLQILVKWFVVNRINRNIVECKLGLTELYFLQSVCELIETLWNVNDVSGGTEYQIALELIETLWNVNLIIE